MTPSATGEISSSPHVFSNEPSPIVCHSVDDHEIYSHPSLPRQVCDEVLTEQEQEEQYLDQDSRYALDCNLPRLPIFSATADQSPVGGRMEQSQVKIAVCLFETCQILRRLALMLLNCITSPCTSIRSIHTPYY